MPGRLRQAAALYEERLALARELGDGWSIAMTTSTLGLAMRDRGDFGRARMLLEESLALYRALGDKNGEAESLQYLALVAYSEGSYDRAVHLLREGIAECRALGRPVGALKTGEMSAPSSYRDHRPNLAYPRGGRGRPRPALAEHGTLVISAATAS